MLPLLHAAVDVEHEHLANGLLWGIAPEHQLALLAVLALPLLVWPFLAWQRAAAAAGRPRAVRFVAGLASASTSTRITATLLLVSAVVHLALLPHHLGGEPGMAVLFVLDGVALAWLAHRAIVACRWRGLTIWLLLANIAAYLGFVLAGGERLDEVGLATRLVELMALAFILVPSPGARRRRLHGLRRLAAVTSFLLVTLLTGITAWAASFAAEEEAKQAMLAGGGAAVGHEMVGMVMQPAGWAEPTAPERAAADGLVEATRAGIAPYQDVAAALAAGYRSSGPGLEAVIHYEHKGYLHDGVALDPTRPEMLVYASTDQGLLLIGAVYALPWPLADAPDAGGGSLTAWHSHTNACLGIAGLVGLLSPFGTCPALSINIATGPMLHVWTVDLPGGPFGLEPDEEAIERWLAGG